MYLCCRLNLNSSCQNTLLAFDLLRTVLNILTTSYLNAKEKIRKKNQRKKKIIKKNKKNNNITIN